MNEKENFIVKLEQAIMLGTYVCISIDNGEENILMVTTKIDDYNELITQSLEIIYGRNILTIFLNKINIEYDDTDEFYIFESGDIEISLYFI